MYIKSLLSGIFLSCLWTDGLAQDTELESRTIEAAQTLINTYYRSTSGLFEERWWNSAAILTSLAGLESLKNAATNPDLETILQTTYTANQGQFDKKYGYYDDEGWWALNWIAAYDLTKNQTYLDTANVIFNDMTGGWVETCGGIYWNKEKKEENTITNILFLDVASQLAVRTPSNAAYLEWAQKQWNWLYSSGALNADVNGGTLMGSQNLSNCRSYGEGLTYVQGVAIDALIALNKAAPSEQYIGNATAIADASLGFSRYLSSDGILTEPVGGFDQDTAQGKGIFMHYLATLQAVAPKQTYVDFANKNAQSIWSKARDEGTGLIGPRWDNNIDTPTVSSHSSAMMGLLAAVRMAALDEPETDPGQEVGPDPETCDSESS